MSKAADRQVERLRAARGKLADEAGRSVFREALRDRHPRVVATAARILRDEPAATRAELEDPMVAALAAWLDDPRRSDPGCLAKTALAELLVRHEADRPRGGVPAGLRDAWRRGARTVQWEKVYGGQADVAGALRAACAAGLVTVGDVEAGAVLTDHLADPLVPVRRAAAANLRARGGTDAALVLRLKARLGDEEPEVLGDVLRALLALDGEAVGAASGWLAVGGGEEAEAVFAEAALALGQSQAAGALEALERAWDATFDPQRRRILVTAVGQTRSDEAYAFLLQVAREAAPDLASEALALLPPRLRDQALDEA